MKNVFEAEEDKILFKNIKILLRDIPSLTSIKWNIKDPNSIFEIKKHVQIQQEKLSCFTGTNQFGSNKYNEINQTQFRNDVILESLALKFYEFNSDKQLFSQFISEVQDFFESQRKGGEIFREKNLDSLVKRA